MKEIKKLNDQIECDREECGNNATVRIKTSEGFPLRLCPKHRRKFEEELREKIENKYEGMDKDEIAEEIIRGDGIL